MKYIVRVEHIEEVEADDEDSALEEFWEQWGFKCENGNYDFISDLNDSAIIKKMEVKEDG